MAPKKAVQETLNINGLEVAVRGTGDENDYISLTDLARFKSDKPKDVVKNWIRTRSTLRFLATWERLNNPDFKGVEFDPLLSEAGDPSFTMSPQQWISSFNAKGIVQKPGRGGGTFAHVDIALDFAAWLSPEFRLYVFQEYKRLKKDETSRLNTDWQNKRMFAAMNYRIHTDAIKDTMPPHLSAKDKAITYATEGDVLNLAVFGKTARQWRDAHPDEDGNMRDHASITQNLILSNLESINAVMIRDGIPRPERLLKLNEIARQQTRTLSEQPTMKKLERDARGTGELE